MLPLRSSVVFLVCKEEALYLLIKMNLTSDTSHDTKKYKKILDFSFQIIRTVQRFAKIILKLAGVILIRFLLMPVKLSKPMDTTAREKPKKGYDIYTNLKKWVGFGRTATILSMMTYHG